MKMEPKGKIPESKIKLERFNKRDFVGIGEGNWLYLCFCGCSLLVKFLPKIVPTTTRGLVTNIL
jgi:hypothetical protein